MTLARIETLTAAPEIGRFYLVPTVRAVWHQKFADWPVIGPKHNDRHCLDFEWDHYHFDARFIDADEKDAFFWRDIAGRPLITSHRVNPDGLPAPVWRRRKCRRLANPRNAHLGRMLEDAADPRWDCHFLEWCGRQARHDGRSWVCPHRNVPLAGQPVVDGAITCPLHFLRIDAETGVVLPQVKGGAV